jgi:hypothetical protein
MDSSKLKKASNAPVRIAPAPPVLAPVPVLAAPPPHRRIDEVILTESFLDALPDGGDDDDDDDEGIWPNEWPSVILSSPER